MKLNRISLLLLLTLFLPIVSAYSADRWDLTAPPQSEHFKTIELNNTNDLAKYLSKDAFRAVHVLITKKGCPQDEITLFLNRKTNKKTLIIAVACYPPIGLKETSDRYYTYLEYPLTIAVNAAKVEEVNLSGQGFMYETGHIAYITDLDGNDMPEFWLAGAICECDGEPEDYGAEGCNCDGGTVVELRNGSLQPWPPKRKKP